MSVCFNFIQAGSNLKPSKKRWLINGFWGMEEVGIIGGCPKSYKSWLALEMALSVSSGQDFLSHFVVPESGSCLCYFAEDSMRSVFSRLYGLCKSRQIEKTNLPLFFIDTPTLRLDIESDQQRLISTIEKTKPVLLILDPLVRLHTADENNASEMAFLLSFLRRLQKEYKLSIVLTHHMSKQKRERGGLSLRGSSDLHAFGDTNAYLFKHNEHIYVELEHRDFPAPEHHLYLKLNTETHPHLCLVEDGMNSDESAVEKASIPTKILEFLSQKQLPQTGKDIREKLSVRNSTLIIHLKQLENEGKIIKRSQGWCINGYRI
jgi:hypothetical protein